MAASFSCSRRLISVIFLVLVLLNITAVDAIGWAVPRHLSSRSEIAHKTRTLDYATYCNDFVQEPPPLAYPTADTSSDYYAIRHTQDILRIRTGFYVNNNNNNLTSLFPKVISFIARSIERTEQTDVYAIPEAHLSFRGGKEPLHTRTAFGGFSLVKPLPMEKGEFSLRGFFSESTNRLCIVGSGSYYTRNHAGVQSRKFSNVVLKLNYSNDSSVLNSLVTGDLQSISDNNIFKKISFMATARGCPNCDFTSAKKNGELFESFLRNDLFDLIPRVYDLEYDDRQDCADAGCNILGDGLDYLPKYMWLEGTRSVENNKKQMVLGFPNGTLKSHHKFYFPFHSNSTLIAEGEWNESTNQFHAVACRIMNSAGSLTDSVVGDCSIHLSFLFGEDLCGGRHLVMGQIWSDRNMTDPSHFGPFGFRTNVDCY